MFNTRSWQPTAEVSDWLKERGFKREATVGTSAAISEITQRACICPPESRSTIVIVSGNSDLFTCIESVLKQDGWNVEVHSWKHQTLPKVLENLHCKTNLLVNYLDQYLARITYIKYNGDFKFKNDVPHNFKQVVLHMTPDPYRDHYKWCKALEDVIRWPFQYHFQIGKTAETDDLVLTFHTDGNGESFDVDNFLQSVNKCPPAGMAMAELYYDNDKDSDNDDSDDDDERCPSHKFCCQYGVECYKVHTDEENKLFEENGGVGLSTQEGSVGNTMKTGALKKQRIELMDCPVSDARKMVILNSIVQKEIILLIGVYFIALYSILATKLECGWASLIIIIRIIIIRILVIVIIQLCHCHACRRTFVYTLQKVVYIKAFSVAISVEGQH